MAAILVAAAAGVFGDGPLSAAQGRAAQRSAGAFSLSYDRFLRRGSPTIIEARLPPAKEPRHLWISRTYLDNFDLESVLPPPERIDTARAGVVFAFPAEPENGLRVSLRLRPREGSVGRLSGRAASGSDTAVEFWQFVYP